MSQTDEQKLTLPPVALSEISSSTKDFILASANRGRSSEDVIISVLDAAALKAGFSPTPEISAEEESATA